MPPNVTFEVKRDVDWDLEPTIDSGEGNNPPFQFRGERSGVVSYSATRFFCRQPFQSFPLQHVAGLVAGGADETGLEARELFPDLLVGEVMDFEFVERLRFERLFEDVVAGFVMTPDRIDKPSIITEPEFYGSVHHDPPKFLSAISAQAFFGEGSPEVFDRDSGLHPKPAGGRARFLHPLKRVVSSHRFYKGNREKNLKKTPPSPTEISKRLDLAVKKVAEKMKEEK
jgi:hypothetical protein